jgi:hypothetical protein
MTERSEGILRTVALFDEGGLMTERSEGIRQHSPPGRPPTKEGS